MKDVSFGDVHGFSADKSSKKEIVKLMETLRQVSLPIEKVDLAVFPCSGDLNKIFLSNFFQNADTKRAVNSLILCGRKKDQKKSDDMDGQVTKISSPAPQMWKEAIQIFMRDIMNENDFEKMTRLVEYDAVSSLEEQLRECIGGSRSANTLLLHMPRYDFHTPFLFFDKKKILSRTEELFCSGEVSDVVLQDCLNAKFKRVFESGGITGRKLNDSLQKFRKDYSSTFSPGNERALFQEMIKIQREYASVALTYLPLKEKDRSSLEDAAAENAGGIVGSREFGRLLRRIRFEGRILNITNPLDTISYILCASSGLPPERVLGFRHNDIERCETFKSKDAKKEVLDIETLIGFHQRSWIVEKGVLPYDLPDPAVNVRISRHVSKLYAAETNTDTAGSMVNLLVSMFQRRKDLIGVSWHHTSESEKMYGAYISGCARLDGHGLFPPIEKLGSRVQDICAKLKQKERYDISNAIICEEDFLSRLCNMEVLSENEKLSFSEIKKRRTQREIIAVRDSTNPFYVAGYDGRDIFLYDDSGRKMDQDISVGGIIQSRVRGSHIYMFSKYGKNRERPSYSFFHLNISLDGIQRVKRYEIPEKHRLIKILDKKDGTGAFQIILPSETMFWYRGDSNNSLDDSCIQVPDVVQDPFLKNGVMIEKDGGLFFFGVRRIPPAQGIYCARKDADSKTWSSLEKVCDGSFEDVQYEKGHVIVRGVESVSAYHFKNNVWTCCAEGKGSHSESVIKIDNGSMYTSTGTDIFVGTNTFFSCADKIKDFNCIDGVVGVAEGNSFLLITAENRKVMQRISLAPEPLKVFVIPKAECGSYGS